VVKEFRWKATSLISPLANPNLPPPSSTLFPAATSQSPKRHLDRFSPLQGSLTWPTDIQTSRLRYSICNYSPHLMYALGFNNYSLVVTVMLIDHNIHVTEQRAVTQDSNIRIEYRDRISVSELVVLHSGHFLRSC